MSIPNDSELYDLAQQTGDYFLQAHKWLCTAESCTGGWLGKVLTDVPGSSAWYERGFITYTNQSKHDLLGVANKILTEFGAVSAETAKAMAQGALDNSMADQTVAITGIAGPGGGTDTKPVGLVWFAWANKNETLIRSESVVFGGEREAVRRQAVRFALQNLF